MTGRRRSHVFARGGHVGPHGGGATRETKATAAEQAPGSSCRCTVHPGSASSVSLSTRREGGCWVHRRGVRGRSWTDGPRPRQLPATQDRPPGPGGAWPSPPCWAHFSQGNHRTQLRRPLSLWPAPGDGGGPAIYTTQKSGVHTGPWSTAGLLEGT